MELAVITTGKNVEEETHWRLVKCWQLLKLDDGYMGVIIFSILDISERFIFKKDPLSFNWPVVMTENEILGLLFWGNQVIVFF